MEAIEISEYLVMFDKLTFDKKVELLSRLVTRLNSNESKNDLEHRRKLLYELYGAWEGANDIDGNEIIKSRSISNREISLG